MESGIAENFAPPVILTEAEGGVEGSLTATKKTSFSRGSFFNFTCKRSLQTSLKPRLNFTFRGLSGKLHLLEMFRHGKQVAGST